MPDVPDLPHERWTVEVDFPDRESAFAAARRWADECGDTALAWSHPPTAGGEPDGWRVKPGTPAVADVVAGRTDIPTKFVKFAQLLVLATPGELSAADADLLWRNATSCLHLFRYGPDFEN